MANLVAIMGAMEEEVAAFVGQMELEREEEWHGFKFNLGKLWGQEVVVVRAGIGKVMTALVAQHLIETYQPNQIIFTGVAGALNPEYKIGDVVVAQDLIQHDLDARAFGYERGQIPRTEYREFRAETKLVKKSLQAELEKGQLHLGRILSGDQFISQSQRSEFEYLRAELKGDAVEMEGAALGQVCAINQVPFIVIRTISDQANGAAPQDYTQFMPQVAANSLAVVRAVIKVVVS